MRCPDHVRLAARPDRESDTRANRFRAVDELDDCGSLTPVNDHEPTPLYHQMAAAGDTCDRVGPEEFVVILPKE